MATRPIADLDAYRQQPDALRLPDRHDHAAGVRRRQAATAKRVAYAEGEDERVLRAVQVAVDEGLAKPILIGRPAVIETRIEQGRPAPAPGRGLRAASTPRTIRASASTGRPTTSSWAATASRPRRRRRRCAAPTPLIAALMVHLGDADAMLCGLVGRFDSHLEHVRDVIGLARGRAGLRRR